jgi:lipid-A-disaccharide synthase
VDEITAWRPHLVLPVDFPGFNLRLARRARARGQRVVYYIAPQVWAWRRERRPGIARAVDRLLVVFPFEEALFKEAGISTAFVGHPLLDHVGDGVEPDAVRKQLEVPDGAPLLALLPGSRSQEVRHILPSLCRGVRKLRFKGVQVAVSCAPGVSKDLYEETRHLGIARWDGRASDLTRASTAAFVASGTATLETGLGGTPLAVVYRTGFLNWHLARALVRIRTVGLVNIAAGGTRVPELLQGGLNPGRVHETARRILFDKTEREEQKQYLGTLRDRLGGEGAAQRAAEEVEKLLREEREA